MTVTNHSMMAELVRLSYNVRQVLGDLDNLIDFDQLMKIDMATDSHT